MRARGSRRPTLFPVPMLVLGLVGASITWAGAAVLALALPQLVFPSGLRAAATTRRLRPLTDPYVRVLAEAASNIGCVEHLMRRSR